MKNMAFAAAAWVAVACSVATAQDPSNLGYKNVMEKIYPGLVKVQIVANSPQEGRIGRGFGSGSGFVISEDGYICTNHHVAGEAERVMCKFPDGEEIPAKLVGTDPALDIAVIKLDMSALKKPRKLQPCVWGDSTKLTFGDRIYVCGSPAGLTQTISEGKVTNPNWIIPQDGMIGDNWKRQALAGEAMGGITRWIGIDANTQGGNSGGALANEKGEVVGVIQVSTGQVHGAIPASDARPIAEQLIKFGEVRRSWTGIEFQPRLRSSELEKGVLVGSVMEDSPASKAGIKAGDIILTWDDQPMSARTDEEVVLARIMMYNTAIGKDVPVRLLRDGKEMLVTVKTVFRERRLGETAELNSWGITGRNITDAMARNRHLDSRKGVLVDTIRPGGPVNNGQPPLKHGDVITKVNGRTIVDLSDLRRLSRELTEGKDDEEVQVLVNVKRGKEEVLTVLNIGREPEEIIPEIAQYATLDIVTQVFNVELAKLMGLDGVEGARVTRVKEGGAGEKAGLKVGDVIYRYGGKPVPAARNKDGGVFDQMVRQTEVGSTVELEIYRGTDKVKLLAKLAEEATGSDKMPHYFDKMFEFSARDITADDRDKMHLTTDQKGAVIRDVDRAGWSFLAKLAIGDILLSVNGQPVEDVKSLKKVMTQIRETKPDRVVFFVKRDLETRFLEVQPTWTSEGAKEKEEDLKK